jgi:hypothetical protein
MPTWKSFAKSSVILFLFFKFSAEFFLKCTATHILNAHLEKLYRIHSRIMSATVFLPHSLASKVFNNLEVFS